MTKSVLKSFGIRQDSLGGVANGHHHHEKNFDSLTYVTDESDAWRASVATTHYQHRGNFWNDGKHATLVRYTLIAVVGIVQACVAYFANITSSYFITVSYVVNLVNGNVVRTISGAPIEFLHC